MKKTGKSLLCLALAALTLLALFALSGCSMQYDGTYYLYDSYSSRTDTDSFVKLDGGKWVIRTAGETVLGTYEISGGRITMRHTMDGRELLDRMIMEQYGIPDGETVEIFSGRVEAGVLALDTQMGELQFEDLLFYRTDN